MLAVVGTIFDLTPLFDRLAWSLAACAAGVHPAEDWDQRPFHRASRRGQKAHRGIAGGFRIILARIVGDLEFSVEKCNFA